MLDLNQTTTGLVQVSTWAKSRTTPPKPNPPHQNISAKKVPKPTQKKIPCKKISPGKYKKKPDVKPELKEIFDRIKAKKESRIKLKNEESKKIIQNEKIIQKENSNLIEERKSQVRQKITMFEEKKITMSEDRGKSLRSDVKIRSDVRSPISGRKFKSKNSRKLEG